MCIAAIIYGNVSREDLQAMEEENPDGGGVSWQDGAVIQFRRGLTAEQIWDLQESGEMTRPYLLHFRWATHGDKVPQLTHPFPLGIRALWGELSGETHGVVIHNGTWSEYRTYALQIPLPIELLWTQSDTAIAACIADEEEGVLDSVIWATAIARMRHEKGSDYMDITTRGTWYKRGDNWFSNLNWVAENRVGRFYFSKESLDEWMSRREANGYSTGYVVPRLPDDGEGGMEGDGEEIVSEDPQVVNKAAGGDYEEAARLWRAGLTPQEDTRWPGEEEENRKWLTMQEEYGG